MKHVMIWLIGLYRKFISPLKPACCRFTPSCSAYAIEAFQKRGFFAGFILTVWRILRCNPFCKGGYDPVPERGFRRVKLKEEHTESEKVAGNEFEAQIATDVEDPEKGTSSEEKSKGSEEKSIGSEEKSMGSEKKSTGSEEKSTGSEEKSKAPKR